MKQIVLERVQANSPMASVTTRDDGIVDMFYRHRGMHVDFESMEVMVYDNSSELDMSFNAKTMSADELVGFITGFLLS